MTTTKVVTWSTKKLSQNNFEWVVYEFGYQTLATILARGVLPTRARATHQAKKVCRAKKKAVQ